MKQFPATYLSETFVLCFTDDDRGLCPVCGREEQEGGRHPWAYRSEAGEWMPMASFEICPECKTQFGYDDSPGPDRSLVQLWTRLRNRFIASLSAGDARVNRAEQMRQ